MSNIEDLNDNNLMLFAMKAYDKPNAVMSEFEDDLNRIFYLKRLLTKYYSNGVLRERLIINHLVIIYNVFGIDAATRILFLKFEGRDLEVLKPFLIFLHYLPKVVYGINGKNIDTSEILMDAGAIEAVMRLK